MRNCYRFGLLPARFKDSLPPTSNSHACIIIERLDPCGSVMCFPGHFAHGVTCREDPLALAQPGPGADSDRLSWGDDGAW